MGVTVVLPGQLRELAQGSPTIRLAGGVATVEEALRSLEATHPGVHHRVVTELGEVRPHVNVFVGSEDIRWTGGLHTPVDDGSEIVILPAVSGG